MGCRGGAGWASPAMNPLRRCAPRPPFAPQKGEELSYPSASSGILRERAGLKTACGDGFVEFGQLTQRFPPHPRIESGASSNPLPSRVLCTTRYRCCRKTK